MSAATDAGENPDAIVDLYKMVKDNTISFLEQFERPVPERVYIHVGETAWDCEQLTFSCVQTYVGPPGDQASGPQPCEGPYTSLITVQLVRCVPTFNKRAGSRSPDSGELEAHALEMLRDQWALLRSVKGYERYNGIIADSVVTAPQGGFQAIVLTLAGMV